MKLLKLEVCSSSFKKLLVQQIEEKLKWALR